MLSVGDKVFTIWFDDNTKEVDSEIVEIAVIFTEACYCKVNPIIGKNTWIELNSNGNLVHFYSSILNIFEFNFSNEQEFTDLLNQLLTTHDFDRNKYNIVKL